MLEKREPSAFKGEPSFGDDGAVLEERGPSMIGGDDVVLDSLEERESSNSKLAMRRFTSMPTAIGVPNCIESGLS